MGFVEGNMGGQGNQEKRQPFHFEERRSNNSSDAGTSPGPGRRALPVGTGERRGAYKRENTIQRAFTNIRRKSGFESDQAFLDSYGAQSPEEAVLAYIRREYVEGNKTFREIGEDIDVSGGWVRQEVIPQVEPGDRRGRWWHFKDPEYRQALIKRSHTSDANQARSVKGKQAWDKLRREEPQKHHERLENLRNTVKKHQQNAEKRQRDRFGQDIEQNIRTMIDQRMTDEAIAAKVGGYSVSNIGDIRRKYSIARANVGRAVSDTDRENAQAAINNGYLAELSERQDTNSERRVVVIQERLVLNPPIPLGKVAKKLGISAEGVRQIQERELKKIALYLKTGILPGDTKPGPRPRNTSDEQEAKKRREGGRAKPVPVKRPEDYTRGDKMRLLRLKLGYTIHQMANESGYSYSYLSKAERNHLPATDEIASLYEKLLNLEENTILGTPRTDTPRRKISQRRRIDPEI